jgi:hypothetical protein
MIAGVRPFAIQSAATAVETQIVAGQKAYIWNMGNALYSCQIRVVMAGDVVDTYEGSGDVNICSQYGALSGGLKGYGE